MFTLQLLTIGLQVTHGGDTLASIPLRPLDIHMHILEGDRVNES